MRPSIKSKFDRLHYKLSPHPHFRYSHLLFHPQPLLYKVFTVVIHYTVLSPFLLHMKEGALMQQISVCIMKIKYFMYCSSILYTIHMYGATR